MGNLAGGVTEGKKMIHIKGNIYLKDAIPERGIMLCARNGDWIYHRSKHASEVRKIVRKRGLVVKKRKYHYVYELSDYGKAMMKLMS